jgi:hypothetical protein
MGVDGASREQERELAEAFEHGDGSVDWFDDDPGPAVLGSAGGEWSAIESLPSSSGDDEFAGLSSSARP